MAEDAMNHLNENSAGISTGSTKKHRCGDVRFATAEEERKGHGYEVRYDETVVLGTGAANDMHELNGQINYFL
jgi:hypothetical protein